MKSEAWKSLGQNAFLQPSPDARRRQAETAGIDAEIDRTGP